MEKATVLKLNLPRGRRVLAVSDIHGDLLLLRRLLDMARFSQDDILFVLGDLLEKGEQSLATLRYLMALSKNHTVYTLNGNCDDLVTGFVDGREELSDKFFRYFIGLFGRRSTLVQMGLEAGLAEAELDDYPKFRAVLRKKFQPEFDFLRALPTIIDTPNLLFVHGGVPSDENMEALDAWRCMKNDDFALQDFSLSKWCVVGHTPATLYRPKIPCANPFIQPEKRLISIDGGCSIKADGQLNLLILPDGYSTDFSFLSADALSAVTALDAQPPSPDSVNIRWGHNTLELLEHGEEFSRCYHAESGRTVDILTDYLATGKDGVLRCADSTDYLLPVSPGDTLSVVRETSRGLLAKKAGVTGWYLGRTGS
ncbi:conserved hypothetical protein [uncultured Eubacteriales bacterium]|uniref:Calcineurin-like phosphoesterase domain-containing protein n=1 Tax=uncultured Eubacteriales bacterium TaxID=172733 RepID=A0A212IUW2_9FIRM|nr:conserved hypothetical protein [uncultured Eubacteriales bacterium]